MKTYKMLNFFAIFIVLGTFILGVTKCRGNDFSNHTQIDATCLNKLSDEVKPYALDLIELIKKDLKEKVPENYINELFCREDLFFTPTVMLKSLTWKETKLPYHQFLEDDRILRAKDFIEKNKELLHKIEETFGIEKEVITAIFLVETDLGRKTGKYPVLNTFFSLALSGNETLFKTYLGNSTDLDFENETTKNRLRRRADWAYKELLYFIEISYKNQWDPFSIKGSIFGAFGYPQFVPKSYVLYGYDWDGDGKVDLYTIPDALASIANYLKLEGYKKEAERDYKKRIIMKYNISEPYAETILKISEVLKKN